MQSVEALALLLTDAPPPQALELVRAAVQTFLHHKGRLSLDRCFKVPSAARFARFERDRHLADALRLVEGSSRARAAAVRTMLLALASGGTYRRWRALGFLPSYASAMQTACYHALACGKDPAVPFVPSDRLLWALARKSV